MKKHYDLVAFMHQEERVEKLEKLKTYIVENQAIVDSTDDKDDGKNHLHNFQIRGLIL